MSRPADPIRRTDPMAIGDVAARSGVAVSALRHYESLGLIAADRTPGGHRTFHRAVLRRLAVIRAGQRVGLSLEEIRASFGGLDPHDAPTRIQWRTISKRWGPLLDARILELQKVRDSLEYCVGCGCLSMRQCALYNPQDSLGDGSAPGARRLFPGAPEEE